MLMQKSKPAGHQNNLKNNIWQVREDDWGERVALELLIRLRWLVPFLIEGEKNGRKNESSKSSAYVRNQLPA